MKKRHISSIPAKHKRSVKSARNVSKRTVQRKKQQMSDIDLEIAKLTPGFDTTKGDDYLKLAKLRCRQNSRKHLDGNYDDVIADASLALAAGNTDAKIVRAYGYYLNGDYESIKRDYRDVIKHTEEEGTSLENDQKLAPVYELFGNIYAKRSKKKDLALAIKFYSAALGSIFGTNMPSLNLLEKYYEACKKQCAVED